METQIKPIRLNESQLYNIIENTVQRIISEGTTDSKVAEKWYLYTEILGPDGMLNALYNYLSGDDIVEFLDWIQRMYDIQDEEDETYDDE